MIEKTTKMTKDKVIKDIPDNLVSTYLNVGWQIAKEVKVIEEQLKSNNEKVGKKSSKRD